MKRLTVLHALSVVLVLIALTGCSQELTGHTVSRAWDECEHEGGLYSVEVSGSGPVTVRCSNGKSLGLRQ